MLEFLDEYPRREYTKLVAAILSKKCEENEVITDVRKRQGRRANEDGPCGRLAIHLPDRTYYSAYK
jgi:hypothetical protein